LTWDTTDDNVNCSKFITPNLFYVAHAFDMGPVFCQHLLAKWIYFHLPDYFHTHPFASDFKPAYAGEQG